MPNVINLVGTDDFVEKNNSKPLNKKKRASPFRVDVYSWARGVTGSGTLFAITYKNGEKKYVLVDYGIIQEVDHYEDNLIRHFDASKLDCVILTHAHADHLARIPMLYKDGYRGKVYTSIYTSMIYGIALNDSYTVMMRNSKIFESEEWYSSDDVALAQEMVEGKTYQKAFSPIPGVNITLIENGHILGACSVYISVEDDNEKINFFVTGDYKPKHFAKKIYGLEDARNEHNIDCRQPVNVITESTYGKKSSSKQRDKDKKNNVYLNGVLEAVSQGKSVICNCISLDRPLQPLYMLTLAQESGELSKDVPIYVVGKRLNEYLEYSINRCRKKVKKHIRPENCQYMDNIFEPISSEAAEKLGDNVRVFKYFDNGKEISQIIRRDFFDEKPKIIIASSGMASFGMSKFLMEEFLDNKMFRIIFTSYLAENTLGKKIMETPYGEEVEIDDELVKKLADVISTSQFSGHASLEEIFKLLRNFFDIRTILVTHGEPEVRKNFKSRAEDNFPYSTVEILGEGKSFRFDSVGLVSEKKLVDFVEL